MNGYAECVPTDMHAPPMFNNCTLRLFSMYEKLTRICSSGVFFFCYHKEWIALENVDFLVPRRTEDIVLRVVRYSAQVTRQKLKKLKKIYLKMQ